MSTSSKPSVVFVCTGNICRSPMAEVILRAKAEESGLGGDVDFLSCGIGGWHVGQKADRRARAELAENGYDGEAHRAQQLGGSLFDATLFVALDNGHVSELVARGVDPEAIRLLRSFDPDSPKGADVDDPYYGGPEGFRVTRRQIEAAAPGILEWVRQARSLS